MNYDTTIPRADLERMLETVAPSWRLETATPTAAGHHAVYHLTVATDACRRECYLKATPTGKNPTVGMEGRLLAVLDHHSTVPVPSVIGVVDEREELPTPYLLLAAVDGSVRPRTELPTVSDATLQAIARDSGRYLASLHAVDAVDAFGFLAQAGEALDGDCPSGDPSSVVVADPVTDWRERLRDWGGGTLSALESSRFGDVVSDARPVLESRIEALEGPFRPALARIDQALENVLLREDSLAAMIDWEFTIAATPAYDLSCVAWSLAGGPYLFAPDTADRRDLVRSALLEGYRERGAEQVVRTFRSNRECYGLLSALRSMEHLEDWFELFDLGDRIDDAAVALRSDVAARL